MGSFSVTAGDLAVVLAGVARLHPRKGAPVHAVVKLGRRARPGAERRAFGGFGYPFGGGGRFCFLPFQNLLKHRRAKEEKIDEGLRRC